MKSLRILPSFLFLILLSFSACKDDDKADPTPTPPPTSVAAPVAAFTQDKDIIFVAATDKSVKFTNTSTNAIRYEWDFGNGKYATIANPTATFDTKGTYTVTLTAYNSENKASTTTRTVQVGSLFITKVKVIQLRFTTLNQRPWDYTLPYDSASAFNDPRNYPDLVASILTNSTSINTETKDDVTPAMLPVELTFYTPELIETNDYQNIYLSDNDGNWTQMGGWSNISGADIYSQWNEKTTSMNYKLSPTYPYNIEMELICEFLTL